MAIDNQTMLICSLAIKQGRLGAAMHNAAYSNLGVNAIYIPLTTSDIQGSINGIRAMNFRGTTISMPYKQEVMKLLDKIDPIAKRIGAVNTVLNRDGVLIGYNSDWIGVVEALKEVTILKGKRVVLVGAGGAARAAAYGLNKRGCKVTIFNRTAAKAKSIAKEFGLKFGGKPSKIKDSGDYDIIINATSVGFYPNENASAINYSAISSGKIAMDVVITPALTQFLKHAKSKGCKIVFGRRMLLHQALFQVKLFTKRNPPFKIMEKALLVASRK
ncbi:MAG: shikimate dehydrogenase [Candidatus Micrarchaeota archaeon]|nr:shikimate dehydrogenase [Candidatus Micrarchaeota archaeon]MDE1847968.1 shikimate dehydrogenase [Candidatus Micrarchaeota archaeon]MDE1864689.1 shikimate dehydrogenase [Candidatus Micrarchaeota archaeon]